MSESEIVGLAGDWHGNLNWAREALLTLRRLGVKCVYHLGDFGIWPGEGGVKYLNHVNATARQLDISILVTPGNHEDWSQINAMSPRRLDGLLPFRSNIAVIPRGHRWEHGGRSFVSLGGAPSIDFEHRTEGVSWWREEMTTEAQAREVASAGYADVMLAHDAPDGGTEAVQAIIDTPPDRNPWSAAGLRYAAEGREVMNIAVAGVRPTIFAHGHYHAFDDTHGREGTRFLSLGCDGQQGNLALLDLRDLAVAWDGQHFGTAQDFRDALA